MIFWAKQKPAFEKVESELAKKEYLDRLSLSADEKKICFQFEKGFKRKVSGRVLYLADLHREKRVISNFNPIANQDEKPALFAYPRWIRVKFDIVYNAVKSLYFNDLKSEKTIKVPTEPRGNYRYPHSEATPK